MWQWMKHGSTTTHLKRKNRQSSGQHLVKAIQSEQKLNSGLARLWHPYFGPRMVFCLSTILRKVKSLTGTITWHYWIDWAQKSRKNGRTSKRKKCCSAKTMHRPTSPWKRWSNWMNEFSNCFLTHHILQIWPPVTTGSLLTWKNVPGKEIWLQWRSDYRNWGLFWEQRRIILQKRHRKVREALEWMYYAWNRLYWWIKSNFSKKLWFS